MFESKVTLTGVNSQKILECSLGAFFKELLFENNIQKKYSFIYTK